MGTIESSMSSCFMKSILYCFTGNIATAITGVAITIATNNVTLDMNGFKLGGLAAGTGTRARGWRFWNSFLPAHLSHARQRVLPPSPFERRCQLLA